MLIADLCLRTSFRGCELLDNKVIELLTIYKVVRAFLLNICQLTPPSLPYPENSHFNETLKIDK